MKNDLIFNSEYINQIKHIQEVVNIANNPVMQEALNIANSSAVQHAYQTANILKSIMIFLFQNNGRCGIILLCMKCFHRNWYSENMEKGRNPLNIRLSEQVYTKYETRHRYL